jgi:hypothetical protein
VLPAPLLLLNLGQTAKQMVRPEFSSTTRQVAAYLKAHRAADEPMYLIGDCLTEGVVSGRNVELLCYWPAPPGKVVVGFVPADRIAERRFWAVYSTDPRNAKAEPFLPRLRRALEPAFGVVESYQYENQSGAVLYERVE